MKATFLLKVFLCLALFASAQDPVDCNCTVTSTLKEVSATICTFHYTYNGQPQSYPSVWIQIKYYDEVCQPLNIHTYRIHSVTIHDSWQANYNEAVANHYTPHDLSTACTETPVTNAIVDKYTDMLVPKSTTTGRIMTYPSGCQSIVKVQWPAGARVWVSNGDLGGATAYPLDKGYTYHSVPCNQICCILELSSNGSGYTRRPIRSADCSNATRQPYVPTMSSVNPNTGLTETYTGLIVSERPCASACLPEGPQWSDPPAAPAFTNVDEPDLKHDLVLSAYPTPVHDVIRFSATETITGVDLYDMQGKKVMHAVPSNNELNLAALKTGIYFMQVEFKDKMVRTVKVYKE